MSAPGNHNDSVCVICIYFTHQEACAFGSLYSQSLALWVANIRDLIDTLRKEVLGPQRFHLESFTPSLPLSQRINSEGHPGEGESVMFLWTYIPWGNISPPGPTEGLLSWGLPPASSNLFLVHIKHKASLSITSPSEPAATIKINSPAPFGEKEAFLSKPLGLTQVSI